MTSDELTSILKAHKLWLEGKPEGVRADLTDANMRDANLRDANLTDANLTDANLVRANLTDANLTDANLTDANLVRANLTGANLTGANLTGANLMRANLMRADLTRADLTRAILWGVIGNMMEVRSAHIDTWPVAWTTSPEGVVTIQIGCQRHTRDEWAGFSGDRIKEMDSRAPAWWAANQDFVLGMVDHFPAVPYGRAGK